MYTLIVNRNGVKTELPASTLPRARELMRQIVSEAGEGQFWFKVKVIDRQGTVYFAANVRPTEAA